MKDGKIVKEEMKFSYTELTALEQYLTQKEENGLRFIKTEDGKIHFEQAPQRKIKYSAVIFTGHSMKSDFIEACEAQGWEFVSSYCDELYIFRTENPDAEEIMTDQKDYLKTVAKRTFFQPGYLGISGFALFLLFKVLILRAPYEGLIVTDTEDCAVLVAVIFSILLTLAKLFQLVFWYIKSNRQIAENKNIPFIGKQQAEKSAKIWNAVSVIHPILMLATVMFLGMGYSNITVDCVICGIFILISLYSATRDTVKKTKNKRKYVSFAACSLVVAIGIFFICMWGQTEYNKSIDKKLCNNGVPISIADITGNENNITQRSRVSATRLGQHYKFSSVYEAENYEESYSVYYEVFVSNYEWVTQEYIALVKKEFTDANNKLIKADEPYGWDELYYLEYNGKTEQEGYAVKGNTVVMVDYSSLPQDADFYELAYNKCLQ
ncbi:MAG: DUF2812 domain-containing protein [Clostridia bacterium]|nr:DUF2812 domain-containing protein [Clostridia bacterium]